MEGLSEPLLGDRFDNPLHHDDPPESVEGPGPRVAAIRGVGQRDIHDRSRELGRECGRTTVHPLEEEGVPTHPVEVLDDPTDPLLGPPDDPGDL